MLLLTSLLLISPIFVPPLDGAIAGIKPNGRIYQQPSALRVGVTTTANSKPFVKSRFYEWVKIGNGWYGNVYRARDRFQGGKLVAIKDLWGNHFGANLIEEVKVLETMSKTNFTRIVRYYGSFHNSDKTYVVLEYLPHGTLKNYVAKKGALKAEIIASVLYQLISAVALLHESGFVHNDLHGNNVMLADIDPTNGNLCVKIVDFGLSSEFDPKQSQLWGYAPKSDIFKLGELLYFLATGTEPWNIQWRLLTDTQFLALSAELRSLIANMVSSDIAKRYSHREVLTQTFVQSGKRLGEKWPMYSV